MRSWKPAVYDCVMKLIEWPKLDQARRKLAQTTHGHVLDIGSGTGMNFPFFHQAERVDAIEPNAMMIEKSKKRKEQALVPLHIHQAYAESLPFPNATFDSIICSLVFCTIPDPEKALQEIERVAKDGATILFLEHVKMEHPFAATLQNVTNPVWKRIADGCHLNRDTLATIQESNLIIKEIRPYYKGLFISVSCVIQKDDSTVAESM